MTPRRAVQTLRAWGMELPVPTWAVPVIGALVLLMLGITAYRMLAPAPELTTLAAANRRLSAEIAEYTRHLGEDYERELRAFDDARGALIIRSYQDGCVLVVRRIGGDTTARLVPDPTRVAAPSAWLMPALAPVVEAMASCDGRCVWHAEAPVRTWYGERSGSRVQVYRQWRDSCTYYQWYDSASGAWDVNDDGSPRVVHTCCTH